MSENGDMTVSEAGRLGGKTTSRKYGREFYEEIGEKGGRIGGPRGGRTTKERYGREFYLEIGQKGGRRVKNLIKKGREAI